MSYTLHVKEHKLWLTPASEPNHFMSCIVQFPISVSCPEHDNYKVGCRWSVFGQWEETHGTKLNDSNWTITIPVFLNESIKHTEFSTIEVAFFVQHGNMYEDISKPWAMNDVDVSTLWYNNDGANFVYSLEEYNIDSHGFEGRLDRTYDISYSRDPCCTVKLSSMDRSDNVCSFSFEVERESCDVIEVGIRYAPLGDWTKGKIALATKMDTKYVLTCVLTYVLTFDHLVPIEFAGFAKYVGRNGIGLTWNSDDGNNYRI